MSADFFFFLPPLDVDFSVIVVVEPFSLSKFTKTLFLKLPLVLYWFNRDRMTTAGVQLESTTGEICIGLAWSLFSIKPLPFVTLVEIAIAVAAALGLWCLEAAVAGVINKGTCSGFSANLSPAVTLNIQVFLGILHRKKCKKFLMQKSFSARKKEEKKRKKRGKKSIFMLHSQLRWKSLLFFGWVWGESRVGGHKKARKRKTILSRLVIPHS